MRPVQREKKDPPRRRDGNCPVCGKELPEIGVKYGDPFCSATCARTWHGLDTAPGPVDPPD